jgi:hypothetical protein
MPKLTKDHVHDPTKESHALPPAEKGGDVHASAAAFDLVFEIVSH